MIITLSAKPDDFGSSKDELLQKIKSVVPADRVDIQTVYLVEVEGSLSADSKSKLARLLNTTSTDSTTNVQSAALNFVIAPRKGTMSPWSSKATDIARNAGLLSVARIEMIHIYSIFGTKEQDRHEISPLLHDRMTEAVFHSIDEAKSIFEKAEPNTLRTVDILKNGKIELIKANKSFGLALSDDEVDYLFEAYSSLQRNPTDVELVMFAQVNSEHCRHKIFNADWVIDGKKQPKSLFKMIKNTYEHHSKDILSAYSDNAAVLKGEPTDQFFPDPLNNRYEYTKQQSNLVIKVETHNHPTAIAPMPGAATGTGGEIRDEGATGRGAHSLMGMAGYTVSNLHIPGDLQPWEKHYGVPKTIATPLSVMIDAPLGASNFANEFGRPNLAGYFRSYEQTVNGEIRGYHKPIMIAGGAGIISDQNVAKQQLRPGVKLAVIGGPGMLIGLGGGAASSMQSGESDEKLDFASVQRANAEMQRRAQEVISNLSRRQNKNPIISIHDVGAGGLSNALPELVHDSELGAKIEIRDIPTADENMSPMEIWCNESQERYVLAIDEKDVPLLDKICKRERCPYAIVGTATKEKQLILTDRTAEQNVVDIPMEVLFGKPPKLTKTISRGTSKLDEQTQPNINLSEAIKRVLRIPAVGSKKFLITIGDRNVGGLTTRDQMIGPWQVPVSDVAVTASSFSSDAGQALSIGERPQLALLDAPAAARMSVGEAITNILAADVQDIADIKLSANWMAASGHKQEDGKLFDAVRALGEEFCPALNLTIPVGKDSLSMRTKWKEDHKSKSVVSPVSLVITAFSPVKDASRNLTPELNTNTDTALLLIDLSLGQHRLGGSALLQAYSSIGSVTPDITPETLQHFANGLKKIKEANLILAYHDRSDGGLITTLLEMAFASRVGLDIDLDSLSGTTVEKLFNEELGVIIQVKAKHIEKVKQIFGEHLADHIHEVARPRDDEVLFVQDNGKTVYKESCRKLEQLWAQTSFEIQKLRDNQETATQEYKLLSERDRSSLAAHNPVKHLSNYFSTRPRVAIFREEGVNGHIEMAAAFHEAGFEAVDVHLNDLLQKNTRLDDFTGLVACGGFSYGDVLGAGNGWAKTILFHKELREAFKHFFERPDTFSLGVCNGCQMLSNVKELIPGTEEWPRFVQNTSRRFEARLVTVEVTKTPSILFKDMEGLCYPLPIAHGEGRTQFIDKEQEKMAQSTAPLRYVDGHKIPTDTYPLNPNGSMGGLTAFTSKDGRSTIMMPHPERAFLTKQMSWSPNTEDRYTPWFRMFQNARLWVSKNQK